MNYNNVNNVNNMQARVAFGANKMDKEPQSFQEQINGMLEKISGRAEKEVADYGDFAPVMEFIPNLDKNVNVGKYGLKIFKMPKSVVEDEKQRYIEAAAYLPAGDYKADMIVGSGNKKEILEMINSEEFAKKLNNTYAELLDVIEDQ